MTTTMCDENDGREIAGQGFPEVILPGQGERIVDAAMELGQLLGQTDRFFNRGGVVVRVEWNEDDPKIIQVDAASLPSAFEEVADLRKVVKVKNQEFTEPTTCGKSTAELILNADAFKRELPPLNIVSPCPVLALHGGTLVQIAGYDRMTGILASGRQVNWDMSPDEAVLLLNELVSDFKFETPADRSRALAALITPALLFGGLLQGRAPVDLSEADQSQTGKGYRNKVTAAIYNQKIRAVTQKAGGVGSLDETISTALIRGTSFVAIDNVRGKIDSPFVESMLTEDVVHARSPYQRSVEVDPRRVVLMITSNKAEITMDLANRSSCVRLRKQPAEFKYQMFPEGDLLDHVAANQEQYLAAVFAIIRHWHLNKMPTTSEKRHDFRRWARVLDWIIQEVFSSAPLLDGHRETQDRMANPNLNWLRDVALIVQERGELNKPMQAGNLLPLIEDTDIEIPGLPALEDLAEKYTQQKVLRAMGKRLAKCFGSKDTIDLGAFAIERIKDLDEEGRARKRYSFTHVDHPPSPAIPPSDSLF